MKFNEQLGLSGFIYHFPVFNSSVFYEGFHTLKLFFVLYYVTTPGTWSSIPISNFLQSPSNQVWAACKNISLHVAATTGFSQWGWRVLNLGRLHLLSQAGSLTFLACWKLQTSLGFHIIQKDLCSAWLVRAAFFDHSNSLFLKINFGKIRIFCCSVLDGWFRWAAAALFHHSNMSLHLFHGIKLLVKAVLLSHKTPLYGPGSSLKRPSWWIGWLHRN